jgi:hypothetical protein
MHEKPMIAFSRFAAMIALLLFVIMVFSPSIGQSDLESNKLGLLPKPGDQFEVKLSLDGGAPFRDGAIAAHIEPGTVLTYLGDFHAKDYEVANGLLVRLKVRLPDGQDTWIKGDSFFKLRPLYSHESNRSSK